MGWKRELVVAITLVMVMASARAVGAQEFELAMVIKETTNP